MSTLVAITRIGVDLFFTYRTYYHSFLLFWNIFWKNQLIGLFIHLRERYL